MSLKTFSACLLIFILPKLAFSQARFSIDAVGGLDYSYRSLITFDDDPLFRTIVESRNESEIGKLSWRAGVNFNTRIHKALFLKTGLRFAEVGYKTKKLEARFPSEFDGNGGFIDDPDLPSHFQSFKYYRFLEVPVVLRAELGSKKTRPFIEAGMSPSLHVSSKNVVYFDEEKGNGSGENLESLKLHFVGTLSVGVNHSFTHRLELFVQPTLRYHLTPTCDAPIDERLINGGLEVGIRRKFTKA